MIKGLPTKQITIPAGGTADGGVALESGEPSGEQGMVAAVTLPNSYTSTRERKK